MPYKNDQTDIERLQNLDLIQELVYSADSF